VKQGPFRPSLNVDLLRAGLRETRTIFSRLDVVDETGSTNADLIARAAAGDDIAGAVLIAEHQTAGRGRCGRTWVDAPRALIAMSAGISAAGVMPQAWGWVPLAAGVAVVDAISATTGIQARLKWPNDVLVDEHKLAGILAEVVPGQPFIVVGIGLNVTLRPDEISEPGATSLLSLGADADRNTLACNMLSELAKRLRRWRDTGGEDSALKADYCARSVTIGSRVRADLPGDAEIVGDAVGVDEKGRLCIDTGDAVVAVSAGDIIHLRPASG
jgi:BirA family transcriptional regulator, biotin operon repressor / biotin---[acetyl-CoA-carboxylase] ligase